MRERGSVLGALLSDLPISPHSSNGVLVSMERLPAISIASHKICLQVHLVGLAPDPFVELMSIPDRLWLAVGLEAQFSAIRSTLG